MKTSFLKLPEKVGWRDHVIGLALGTAYAAWLLATVRSLGFARDEGMYFRAASTYWRWFDILFTHPSEAFKQQTIDGIWSDNHEHPPLIKDLFAFSWHFLHEKWHVFADASTAYRFPGIAMSGITLWITYLFGARAYSRQAGVVAAVLFALMPRVFYNAHLACFDLPIVCMWTWCLYVYWRTQVEGGWLWALGTAAVFGLTLASKHNAWILPPVIIPHAIVANWREPVRGLKTGRLGVLVLMGVIGPALCYALWPWLWNDTRARVEWWVAYHSEHVYYNMEFLHKTYFSAPSPRLYMPFMILATVPTVTLALFVTGLAGRLKLHYLRVAGWLRARREKLEGITLASRDGEADLLFLIALGGAVGPWLLLPTTPIFGGTKHWMPGYVFLCLFAGYGFDRVAEAMKRTLGELARFRDDPRLLLGAQVALYACVFAAPLAVTVHSHPFGLSSYVPLVGGTAGGADLGLNRQFWGFTTQSLEPYFEANAPKGATVYFHDTFWESWAREIDEKRIRPDLRGSGTMEADFAIVHLERHMLEVEYNEWSVFGTDVPDYVLTHDGVPIIDVFRRRR